MIHKNQDNNGDLIFEIQTTGGPVEVARIRTNKTRIMNGKHYYAFKLNGQIIFSALFDDDQGKPGTFKALTPHPNFFKNSIFQKSKAIRDEQ